MGDGEDDADLLAQQERLQREAAEVQRDLALGVEFSGLGRITEVGSAALGLMVWRDIDLTVVCPRLDLPRIAASAARIAGHQRVWQVLIRDDTDAWRTDAGYPDGIYVGLRYRTAVGDDWNVDIWFIDRPDRQPDLTHAETLPARLTAEARRVILRIKTEWARRPEYGGSITSYDIYTAVLDSHVRSLDDFDLWLERREDPATASQDGRR